MAYTNPGKLFIQRFGLVECAEDVMRYVGFLRDEAGISAEPPIDLAPIHSRFGIPLPKYAPLPDLQGILLNPDHGLILIKEDDPAARQRFTAAHELIELLFSALPSGKGWAARRSGNFKSNPGSAYAMKGQRNY